MFAALNSFLTRAVSGYFLNKSLRFRSSASAYLNRTFGTPTNNLKWTWSAWVKRGTLSSGGVMFQGYASLSNRSALQFNSSDQLFFNGSVATATTTAVFRDPAAWYHIVCVYDSANATAANRLLLYVNGTLQTVTGTQPTASQVEYINGAWLHYISTGYSGAFEYLDEDLAEINFVDGQALAPTSFGATGANSQWLPKAYTGTYGTNGFYLPFNANPVTTYAGSFNGSSQYLTVPNNAAFTLGATATMEAWIYVTSVTGNKRIITTGSNFDSFDFALYNSTNTVFVAGGNANTTTAIPLNTWMHVAAVFNSGTLAIYFNGIAQPLSGVTTGYSLVASTYAAVFISNQDAFPGYISNLRVVKGTAVYTANFVPPTTNLTAITNTSLLTLQGATIVDNSTNAFTITNVGTVVTSVQSPFLNPTVLTADSSGNANNWTPNNISLTAGSTYDSLTDVPTLTSTTVANYAVLNPLFLSTWGGGSAAVPSNANLTIQDTTIAGRNSVSTISVNSGKWYFETQSYPGGTANNNVGIAPTNIPNPATVYFFGHYSASYPSGSIIGVVLDFTALTIKFYVANVLVQTTSIVAGDYTPIFQVSSNNGSTATMHANFGQQPFTYTAPTDFLPLNTFNIPAGTVTTSGTFTGNLSTDGPMVYLNGTPTAMTINGNAVTVGTQADKLANGFKVRSSSASYNASGSNTYVATTVGEVFKYEDAQANP